MNNFSEIQTEQNYKTDKNCLLEEILITIGDYFNMHAVQTGNNAVLSLDNGQRFIISIAEA